MLGEFCGARLFHALRYRLALNPTVSFDLPERVLRHLSAAGTAWQCAQQGTCEADAQSCNGVRHMALRSQRQHLWVDNRREREIASRTRRETVLRGEGSPFRRPESHKRRYRGW